MGLNKNNILDYNANRLSNNSNNLRNNNNPNNIQERNSKGFWGEEGNKKEGFK